MSLQIAVDQLSWDFDVNRIEDKHLADTDDGGVYVTGLFLEGAGWESKQGTLCEARSMQLVTPMPTILFKPVEHKKKSVRGRIPIQLTSSSFDWALAGLYVAPCYYSSARTGSFVVAVELRTGSMPAEHWIKRATALLMNLDS